MNRFLRSFLERGVPFMAEDGGSSGSSGAGEGEGGKDGEGAEKTYTQDEVMALLQSETDKRVAQALKKQKKEIDKQTLSGLDKEQREAKEKELRIQELEEKLKGMNQIQTKNEVIKVLNARGLSADFADIIEIGEDAEEAQKKIETLDKLIKKSVTEEVKKRIGSETPKGGNAGSAGLTKEAFAKMTLAQRNELYAQDKEAYMKISNGG